MKKNLILIFLVPIFVVTSCNRVYYIPSTQNVPLLTESTDFRLSGTATFGQSFIGADFQVAYSPIKHLGIMANGFWGSEDGEDVFQTTNLNTGRFLEFGLGGYYPISDFSTFEAYGGYGKGTINYSWSFNNPTAINYDRIFMQFTAGIKQDIFEIAITDRFSFVNYTNISQLEKHSSFNDYYKNVPTRSNYLFQEPSVTLRVGFPLIKYQTQIQRNFQMTGSDLAHNTYVVSLGFIVSPDLFLDDEETDIKGFRLR